MCMFAPKRDRSHEIKAHLQAAAREVASQNSPAAHSHGQRRRLTVAASVAALALTLIGRRTLLVYRRFRFFP